MKRQGTSTEELRELLADEKFDLYRNISRESVMKQVKIAILFQNIVAAERIFITDDDLEEDMREMYEEYKQRLLEDHRIVFDRDYAKEQLAAEKLKKKIFDFLAKHSKMTYIDPPPDVTYHPSKE